LWCSDAITTTTTDDDDDDGTTEAFVERLDGKQKYVSKRILNYYLLRKPIKGAARSEA
jgi:hypothetical protein